MDDLEILKAQVAERDAKIARMEAERDALRHDNESLRRLAAQLQAERTAALRKVIATQKAAMNQRPQRQPEGVVSVDRSPEFSQDISRAEAA